MELQKREDDSATLYFAAGEEEKSLDLLLFQEELVSDKRWKRASQKGRQLWHKLKERYEHFSVEAFAGDRFLSRLKYFRKITVLLNRPIEPALVKQKLRVMLRDRSYHHLRWMAVDILLLPFTFFTMFLPGPNVFFFYLLFRIYSHWKSFRAASLMSVDSFDIRLSPEAKEVSAFLRKSKDMKTALVEMRKKYGLRALQEHKFLSQMHLFRSLFKYKETKAAKS